MKETDKFQIDIFKLKNAKHEYDFEFDSNFFASFEGSIIEKGHGSIRVLLDKTESFITLTITISGVVELICDRSLDPFDFSIESSRSILFKYGEEEKEIDDEIIMITRSTQRLNLAQYFYEFIGIEIPMKRLHPRYVDETEEDEMVYTDENTGNKDRAADPRWAALKKLKEN